MKRLFLLSLCLSVLFCGFAGCTETGENISEEELFTLLFDIRNKITLQLNMSDAELAKMQADYENYDRQGSKSPIYRMADLHVTIETPDGSTYAYTVKEVGVRMKGNTSRTDFYSDEEGLYNLVHLKISFQETFDDAKYYGADAKVWGQAARDARKNRTFATLEKLDLRWNRCDDGTYLKEYFAYETYRQNGVLAPHTNLASFDWAGVHMGVFTINEPIDEIFLAKNLPQDALGGDLYKVGWAGSQNGSFTSTKSIGIEDEDNGKFYAYDLKTNKKTSANASLTNLIERLNSGDVSKESFAELVDLDTFLPFCAVSYLLGNPDDMRNNYNNFYLYFRGDNGKAVFIPYDYDRCLGITAHWNPTGDGMTGDDPFSSETAATGEPQKNPVILYSVASGGHYIKEYAALLSEIAESQWFTCEQFAALYDTAKANYADLTRPEKELHNTKGLHLTFDIARTSDFSANGNISFRAYRNAKLETLNFYLGNLDHYLEAKPNVSAAWYIRSDVTKWQNDPDYAMTEENGVVSIHITVSSSIWLKVYHDVSGRWYGSECISEDCAVPFTTDDHTNIILEKGSYVIIFDPAAEIITLEEK